MRSLSNLSWPDTPYGADKRPFGRHVQLLTGMAMQWAEDGEDLVPVSAAAVFIPVKRTTAVPLAADTMHFGFRVLVAEHQGDAKELLRFVDGVLVQGRRHAAGIAWDSYADDLHVIQARAPRRLPGVTAVGGAWQDRTQRERGTAPLVDTAFDLGERFHSPLISHAAAAHGFDLGHVLSTLLQPATVQDNHEALADGTGDREELLQQLAASVLTQALVVALLGGKAMDRLTWPVPFDLAEALRRVAWHEIPFLETTHTPARAEQPE